MPEAKLPMLSAENGPEALVAWVAVRPDRVASVDCVGVGVVVCCAQDVPMLRETGVPAVHPGSVVEANRTRSWLMSAITNSNDPTQSLRARSAAVVSAFNCTNSLFAPEPVFASEKPTK